jgi:di/tricarboxylate transporter
MTLEQILLLVFFGVLASLFLMRTAFLDLIALCGILILIFSGVLGADEAFSGFASSAVLTMVATFFLGAALAKTGVADHLADKAYVLTGGTVGATVFVIAISGAALSAFMNNVAAAVVLLPAVIRLSTRSGISASKLGIPLAFGTVLGGMCTVVGTPANILGVELIGEYGLGEVRFFDFSYAGLPITVCGALFLAVIGHRLLVVRTSQKKSLTKSVSDLTHLYDLEGRLYKLVVDKSSSLSGALLKDAGLGDLLDLQVLLLSRSGQKAAQPSDLTRLQTGDELIVRALHTQLETLAGLRGAAISSLSDEESQKLSEKVKVLQFRVAGAATGKNLRELHLRSEFGLSVLSISRPNEKLEERLSREELREDDVITLIGEGDSFSRFSELSWPERIEGEGSLSDAIVERIWSMSLGEDSSLVGKTLREARLSEFSGISVQGVLRKEELIFSPGKEFTVEAGDVLLVSGQQARLELALSLAKLNLELLEDESGLSSQELLLTEITFNPRSEILGQSLKELNFRDRFAFQVLGIWRRGEAIRAGLAEERIELGDVLLVQGPREKAPRLVEEPDVVLLDPTIEPPRRWEKAPYALMGLLLMIFLAVTRLQPIYVAAFAGAAFCVLTGAVSLADCYKNVEWKVVFLVAFLIPMGNTIESSGLSGLAANLLLDSTLLHNQFGLLVFATLAATLVSQMLDATVSVAMLYPIFNGLALQLGFDPLPILLAISWASSIAFLTPFSHKANLLVMGVGAYKSRDYFKLGLPLTLLSFAVLWSVLWFFPY